MKQLRVGSRVKLKNSAAAEWYLENPECLIKGSGEVSSGFFDYMELSSLCSMGYQLFGTVIKEGLEGHVLVKWDVPKGFVSYDSFFDGKDLSNVL